MTDHTLIIFIAGYLLGRDILWPLIAGILEVCRG